MLRYCRLLRYDSFQAARGEVSSLFSPFKTNASLHSAVRRYVLHRSRHMDGLHKSQQRSWVRSKVGVLLQEARRRQNYEVAEATLLVALSAPDLIDTVEATWLKDVLASCTTTEELQRLDATLRSHADAEQQALRASSADHGPLSGASRHAVTRIQTALTAFLSTTHSGSARAGLAGHHGRAAPQAMTLGDNDDVEEEAAQWAIAQRGAAQGDWMTVKTALTTDGALSSSSTSSVPVVDPPSEEDVSHALVRHAPRATGQDVVPPDQRALHALRRLQHHRAQQVVAPNPSFLRYFLRQGLVRDEAELTALFTALRDRPVQVGFRLHLSQPHGRLAQTHMLAGRVGLDPVPWLPAFTGAYTLDCGPDVPYDALLANRRLLQSLAKERVGAYQSLSSLLPVHFLAPQPGDCILDMCAAPGGKTTLLYDYLVGSEAGRRDASCVVANEPVHARAQSLARRLQNWSPQIGVTSLRGETMAPITNIASGTTPSGMPRAGVDGGVLFNKVLVDAPCSGEGRMGREVLAWRLWHPTRALEYFDRQRALLRQAVNLCAPGGTIVYATCTLNPIENEAVVAAVLRECGDAVRLVTPASAASWQRRPKSSTSSNATESDPHLAPGLGTWWVPSRSGGFYRTVHEARAQGEPMDPALFAPLAEDSTAAREQRIAEQLRQGCWRVLPHLNPGMDGFFLAVLERTGARPSEVVAPLLPAAASRTIGSAQTGAVRIDETVAQSVLGPRTATTMTTSPSSSSSSTSVLREKGWLSLPAHHPLVLTHLAPFFARPTRAAKASSSSLADSADPTARLATMLETRDLHGVWSDAEGLRLVSGTLLRTLGNLQARDSTSAASRLSSSAALLEAGVLAFNASGELTESGATLLAALDVPSRVLSLPRTYYTILLANQRLDVHEGLDGEADLVQQALRTTSNGLVGSRSGTSSPWAAPLLAQVGRQAGNALVVLQSETGLPSTRALESAEEEEAALWAVPVQVHVRPHGVELRLLLTSAARHRCTAMLGRVQSARTRSAGLHRTRTSTARAAATAAKVSHRVPETPSPVTAPTPRTRDDHSGQSAASSSEFVFEL